MHGLLAKLGGLDSSAARGLRVVEFFDQLVLHNAGLEAVTRATAVLSEVTAGAVLDHQGHICTIGTDGRTLPPTGPSAHALINDIVVDGDTVGRVWLERDSTAADPHEWDELIIERMAMTIATLHTRIQETARPQLGLAHPATLHLLINDSTSESETARAARLLGFNVGAPVRVIAVASTRPMTTELAELRSVIADNCSGRVVAAAMSSTLAVILAATATTPKATPPDGAAVCVGPVRTVENCSGSWRAARQGVRFAMLGGLWPRWNTTEDLGCLVALTALDRTGVAADPDVQAIARLAVTVGKGQSDIRLLDCYGWLPSIRETASALHMHHSSVNYRLESISTSLGYDIRTAAGRYRVRTALMLWQLHVA